MIDALRDSFVMTPPAPNTPGERRHAVLYTANNARDAGDCAQLLDMLGLSVADARPEEVPA